MKEISRLENIVKSYGEEKRRILDGISLSVSEGEFVSIMGPSGSGKSTLLFAMSGMDSVDSGTVFFHGESISSLGERELAQLRKTQMGFVFQQPTLLKNLNILDNIILPAVSGNRKQTAEITMRAKALMKKMGIAELCHRDITQVSGGQLQRAGICRALLAQPQMIFGDEPTGSLNSKATDEIMEILSAINAGGVAVMLVTHDAKVASRAQRVLFMVDGKIKSELSLPKWAGNGSDERTQRIMGRMQQMGI